MEQLKEKAKVLLEALPYIRNFYGKVFVIKYGGHAMVREDLKKSFALNLLLLKLIGINPVVVHGGGPQIGKFLEKLGKQSKFIEGMRVTDDETMDIVEMVLVGKVNKEIVNNINLSGGKAVGLSGKDGKLIMAKKLLMYKNYENKPPEIIDIGKVGEVENINGEILEIIMDKEIIPVVAPVGVDSKGNTYNINADLVAGEIAIALGAEKLIMLTDTNGVMDEKGKVISSVTMDEVNRYISDNIITGGMIPKVQFCKKAVENGVKKAHIVDGRVENVLLLEIFTKEGVGTEIVSYE